MHMSQVTVATIDNVSVYINLQIIALAELAGHLVCSLSPYSPGFNPIDLMLDVFKA